MSSLVGSSSDIASDISPATSTSSASFGDSLTEFAVRQAHEEGTMKATVLIDKRLRKVSLKLDRRAHTKEAQGKKPFLIDKLLRKRIIGKHFFA